MGIHGADAGLRGGMAPPDGKPWDAGAGAMPVQQLRGHMAGSALADAAVCLADAAGSLAVLALHTTQRPSMALSSHCWTPLPSLAPTFWPL